MEKESEYCLSYFMEIKFGFPIGAMAMNSHFLLIGTVMGKIEVYIFKNQNSKVLLDNSNEDITSISFEDEDCLNVALGDYCITQYQFDLSDLEKSPDEVKVENYKDYNTHKKNCENCYTMLSGSSMFQIQLELKEEQNKDIQLEIKEDVNAEYRYRERVKSDIKTGKIKTTNFVLPFDFDGENFLWVEYIPNNKRKLCVLNVSQSDQYSQIFEKVIPSDFGHISYCKFLPNETIFIVRRLTICEIRKLNNELEIVKRFDHIGSEVIAVDIWYKEENISKVNTEMENLEQVNLNTNNQDDILFKLQSNNPSSPDGRNQKFPNDINPLNRTTNENMINYYNHLKKNRKFVITLLDIYGNVNVWDDNKITNCFNLYKVKNISKEHRVKDFFSLGYCYYICFNGEAFAISTDHGCYIIQRNNI